jgi:hypothetical protein
VKSFHFKCLEDVPFVLNVVHMERAEYKVFLKIERFWQKKLNKVLVKLLYI